MADSIYPTLPEQVGHYDLALVKRIVPLERFAHLVQDAFDRFDRFFVGHQAHFGELFEKWKGDNSPT